jgi:hypothetical protein
MIPLSIIDEIESRRFIADIGVVSTPKRFEAALAELRPVRELLGCLRSSADKQQLINHVRDILQKGSDADYTHAYDVPLAVYLRALDISAPLDAYELAQAFKRLPNLWWARFIANKVLSGPSLIHISNHVLWNPSGAYVRGIGSVPRVALRTNFEVSAGDDTAVIGKARASTTVPTTVRLHGDDVLTRAVATAA